MSHQVGPIKNFVLGIYDGPHATPKESEEGPVFLGIKNVTSQGSLDLNGIRHISEQDYPKWTKRVVPRENDIVFSYEATLHRYALIPKEFRCCLGRRMGLVRPDPTKVNPRYLYYYFLTSSWRRVVESNVISGATVDRIPLSRFPEFEVSIPSLPIQQQIASILSAYDDLIENNRRRIQLLEESARLLYKEWFVHLRFPGHEHVKIIDSVPEGWLVGTIGDFFDINSGGTPSRKHPEFFEGKINWVKTQELNEDFIFNSEEKITETALKKSSATLFPANTILVSIYGGTNIGRTGIVAVPSASNQACVALFPRHKSANFIYAQLFIQHTREFLIGIAQGAAQTNISQQTLRKIPMTMPPESVMGNFLGICSPIYEQFRNLNQTNNSLAKARDLLLPRLMNGDIAI